MAAPTHRWRSAAIGLVFGGVALGLALWGVPLADIGMALRDVNPTWLVIPACLFLFQQVVRSVRQMALLRSTHPDHTFRSSLSVLCVSFFFINVLPARTGEVVRPMLLLERDNIPLGAGFAMVFIERLLDLTAMCAMVGIAAVTLPDSAGEQLRLPGGGSALTMGRWMAAVGMPLIAGVLITALFAGPKVVGGLMALWPDRGPATLRAVRRRVASVGLGFGTALSAKRSAGTIGLVLATTLLTWGVTIAMYPALAMALGLSEFIGMREGIGILGFTMVGMAVPSAPGFAGTYEAFARLGLALYGVVGETRPHGIDGPSLDGLALAFALTMHWGIHLVQSSTAAWFLAVDRLSPREIVRRAWRGAPSADSPPQAP